ncbi:MAG: S-methyl-5'-thioadenosine phosphorylase [Candidatus Asgardarchaeia archaeon]
MEKRAEIGIIGGSGFYELFEDAEETFVNTPFGLTPKISIGTIGGKRVAFLPRHARPGSDVVKHEIPPHKVNYRANIYGLFMLGVERIITSSASGTLNKLIEPGDLVIPDQFIDLTKSRKSTFYDGEIPIKVLPDKPPITHVVHVDVSQPYCPEIRKILLDNCAKLNLKCHSKGVYVNTEGPRFETPAEIKMMQVIGGDIVGMTNATEAILARELGLCYATVAIITNWAAGIQEKVSHEEVIELFAKKIGAVRNLFFETIKSLPRERHCHCKDLIREAIMD